MTLTVKSIWHIEKDGRSLYIDSSGQKRESILIITSLDRVSGTLRSRLRATTTRIASKMKLRNFMLLTPDHTASVGPFSITAESSNNENSINILIDADEISYYYLSALPDIPLPFAKDVTILFPADEKPREGTFFTSIKETVDYLKFVRAKNVILSGKYSEEWKKIIPINSEIKEEFTQLEFDFS